MPELPEALVAFHDALDGYPGYPIGHGRDPGWVDDCDVAVMEALLSAGWTPRFAEGTDEGTAGEVVPFDRNQ